MVRTCSQAKEHLEGLGSGLNELIPETCIPYLFYTTGTESQICVIFLYFCFLTFSLVRVELFFDSCEEMKSWIQEKDAILSDGDVGRDLETVRALQRRHQVSQQKREIKTLRRVKKYQNKVIQYRKT